MATTDSPPPGQRGPDMAPPAPPPPVPAPVLPPAAEARSPRRRPTWPWLVALAVLAIVAAASVPLVSARLAAAPPVPSSSPAPSVPAGSLPPQPPVPTPPVVAQLQALGLTCLDEAYEPWLVKGCHAAATGRIVQVRMKVDAQARIEKFQVQVLDGNVDDRTRTREFGALLAAMLVAAEVPGPDQQRIRAAVVAETALEFVPITWGEVYLPTPTPTVRTITLTRSDVDPSSLTTRPVFTDYADLTSELTALGYRCTERADLSFRCAGKRAGEEFSGAINNGQVLTVNISFDGPRPAPDAPLLLDAYALLRGLADPHAGALTEGLARMAMDAPEQLFVANYRILRWEQRFEIGSVEFV